VEVGGPSGRPSNGAAGRLALLALVTAILVVLAGLFASPASATTTLHPQTRVAAIAEPSGQLVGPHATVLAVQGRERAPDYDSSATGSSVAAEDGTLSLSGRLQTESSFGDRAIQNALKVPAEPGYFDVVGHGTPTDISGLSPSQLADQITSEVGWQGQNVRLLSCSTGCPSGTYAQELANDLGVTVQAPTTDLYVSSRGGITFDPGGGWAYFSPGG
jgi:hypothetical protein